MSADTCRERGYHVKASFPRVLAEYPATLYPTAIYIEDYCYDCEEALSPLRVTERSNERVPITKEADDAQNT